MYTHSLERRNFHHRSTLRQALVTAEFPHPETGESTVTWYQTSDYGHESPIFFTASREEFLTWFPKEIH